LTFNYLNVISNKKFGKSDEKNTKVEESKCHLHIPKSPPTKDHPRFQSISSKTIPAFERINGLFTKQFFLSLQKTNKSEHFRHC
jgi:hypothetical protein